MTYSVILFFFDGRVEHQLRETIMLAELAIANAAFSVIKETVQNGGDIFAAGSKIFEYFDAKSTISKKVQENGGKSDLEEFMALEQLKEQEAQLKQMMIYQGRGGLWDDWLAFQVQAKKKRENAEREARLKKQKIIERIKNTIMITVISVMGIFALALIIWIILLSTGHSKIPKFSYNEEITRTVFYNREILKTEEIHV
jgi:hypothetical protein